MMMTADETAESGWAPSWEQQAKADDVYFDDLPVLDISVLSDWLGKAMEARGTDRATDLDLFSDALFDLSQLVDELRYEAAVGSMYLFGLSDAIAASVPEPLLI
jgi:hypothetical protein